MESLMEMHDDQVRLSPPPAIRGATRRRCHVKPKPRTKRKPRNQTTDQGTGVRVELLALVATPRRVLARCAFLALGLLFPRWLVDLSYFLFAAGLVLPLLMAEVVRLGRDDRAREAALTRAASRPDRLTVASARGVELCPFRTSSPSSARTTTWSYGWPATAACCTPRAWTAWRLSCPASCGHTARSSPTSATYSAWSAMAAAGGSI